MLSSKVAYRTALVAARANTQRQQRRGIVDYLTNYPDKVCFLEKMNFIHFVVEGIRNPENSHEASHVFLTISGQ